jgi:hypothetical protein
MYLLDLENKKIIDAVEYKNSWGSAPYIWDKMATTYLHWSSWLRSDCDPLWKLFDDNRIQPYQRAVLGMTFDKAIISSDYYKRAVDDIRRFLQTFPPDPTHVNHWAEIADYIERLKESADTCIGFWMTSVSGNPLFTWNEETEEENITEKLYNVYEELEATNERN